MQVDLQKRRRRNQHDHEASCCLDINNDDPAERGLGGHLHTLYRDLKTDYRVLSDDS